MAYLGTRLGAAIRSGKGVTAIGTAGGFGALLSAAACCVLPLAFAAAGLGVGGLAFLVPFHWPLTIGAGVAVAVGWAFYARKRQACAISDGCAVGPPSRATLILLLTATIFVILSAIWPGYIEAPLMRALAGS